MVGEEKTKELIRQRRQGAAVESTLYALSKLTSGFPVTPASMVDERKMSTRKGLHKRGLGNFIPYSLWCCPKLTLRQDSRLRGALFQSFIISCLTAAGGTKWKVYWI